MFPILLLQLKKLKITLRGLARYGHRMLATALKKVPRQTQNMLTPPNQAQLTVSVVPFEWCSSFETVFEFGMVRKGFMSISGAKSAFFGASKTALSKFTKYFFPQIL